MHADVPRHSQHSLAEPFIIRDHTIILPIHLHFDACFLLVQVRRQVESRCAKHDRFHQSLGFPRFRILRDFMSVISYSHSLSTLPFHCEHSVDNLFALHTVLRLDRARTGLQTRIRGSYSARHCLSNRNVGHRIATCWSPSLKPL